MPKILPERPDIAQLKTQARELQRAYNAGDRAARHCFARHLPALRQRTNRALLTAAQTVLARAYGFASWPQLRRHVEQIRAAGSAMTKRQQIVAGMAARIATAAAQHDLDALFAALQIGRRDTDAVRALLIAQGRFHTIVAALLTGAAHPKTRVRFLTAQALDHWADERCAAPLWVLLHDPVPRVRWAALHSLQCAACKLTPLATAPNLVAKVAAMALSDPSITVRRVATWELGQLCPGPQAVAALTHLAMQEPDSVVARNAQIGLRRAKQAADAALGVGGTSDATGTG